MNAQPITIRPLGPEDVDILDRVRPGGFETPIDPQRAWAFLNTRLNDMVVAISDGQVVGYACGTVLMQPAKATAFLVTMVEVHPDFRRQGAARKMLTRLMDAAWDRGCEKIWLRTARDTPEGRALFASLDGIETDRHVVFTWQ